MKHEETLKLSGKKVLAEFKKNISRVIVEFGKWGEYGFKHYSAEEWFLHYSEIQKVKSAHVIVLYKDGTFEELSSGEEIKKKVVQNWIFGRALFIKMFFKYLFGGLINIGLVIRIYRLRKK